MKPLQMYCPFIKGEKMTKQQLKERIESQNETISNQSQMITDLRGHLKDANRENVKLKDKLRNIHPDVDTDVHSFNSPS
jgi:predicted RNase H-like nuclease (RuvC/YqgF family)